MYTVVPGSFRLLVPYFEFLRLVAWVKMTAVKKLAGFGSVAVSGNQGTLNQLHLAFCGDDDDRLFEELSWEMAIRPAVDKALLWFYYDRCLLIEAGVGAVIDKFSRNRPADTAYSLSLIIGAGGNSNACINLHEPFLMRKSVQVHLMLPTVDETAAAHWREEYASKSGVNTDLPVFIRPNLYAYSIADHSLFFGSDEPVIPISAVYSELKNNKNHGG